MPHLDLNEASLQINIIYLDVLGITIQVVQVHLSRLKITKFNFKASFSSMKVQTWHGFQKERTKQQFFVQVKNIATKFIGTWWLYDTP